MYDMVTIAFMEILGVIGLRIKGFLKQERIAKNSSEKEDISAYA